VYDIVFTAFCCSVSGNSSAAAAATAAASNTLDDDDGDDDASLLAVAAANNSVSVEVFRMLTAVQLYRTFVSSHSWLILVFIGLPLLKFMLFALCSTFFAFMVLSSPLSLFLSHGDCS